MAAERELDVNVPTNWTAHQAGLPDLPIPTLAQSLELFFACVEPLISAAEIAEAKRCAEELLSSDLQARLIAYDKTRSGKASFIEAFWTDAYLAPDASVVLNVNPFFILEEDPTPFRNSQIDRASSLTFSSLKFVNVMRCGELKPDVWRGTPLCMSQLCGGLFGCARVPQQSTDFIRRAPLTKARHVVVLCRSQFYSFQALGEDDTVMLDEADIARILHSIERDAVATAATAAPGSRAVGILTAHNRSNWAVVRATLEATPRNRDILARIDSALFVLCLDDIACSTVDEVAANALHGTYDVNAEGAQIGTF